MNYKLIAYAQDFVSFLLQSLDQDGNKINKNISVWRLLYGYKQRLGKKIYVKKGLVKEYNGKKLARGVFIVPADHAQKISLFLRKNKFEYKMILFCQESQ